jgi:hypothetical protein
MTTTSFLTAEYQTIRTAVGTHRKQIERACDVLDAAIAAANIPVVNGFYAVDLQKEGWRYPSIDQAQRELEALRDDNGFYWAESRLTDLERLLGLGWATQTLIPFEGTIPDAHPVVKDFLTMAALGRGLALTNFRRNIHGKLHLFCDQVEVTDSCSVKNTSIWKTQLETTICANLDGRFQVEGQGPSGRRGSRNGGIRYQLLVEVFLRQSLEVLGQLLQDGCRCLRGGIPQDLAEKILADGGVQSGEMLKNRLFGF